jgi:membrane peptidoglycan carboxypeptidase
VVPEEYIADLNSMLAEVVKAGTARRADLGFAPQGGKTGTNQGYRDAWYIGFTAHNVTGVWVGNDDYSPMKEVTGGRIPAPAWKKIMDVAEAGLVPESVAGIPLDDTYTAVAAAQPVDGVPIADETPDTSEVAVGGETRDILDDITSLFQKDQRVLTAPESVATKSLYGDDGDSVVLPKVNVRKKSKGDFLDSLFKPKKKKKRKKFFSF